MSVFITGTDTDVGKTVVSAMLLRSFSHHVPVAYWKPVATGLQIERDTDTIIKLCGKDLLICQESYRFKQPLSPHLAAPLSGKKIHEKKILNDFNVLTKKYSNHTFVIEGAGGLFVPLNSHYFMIDLLKDLNIPCLLVTRSSLGTINHTVLSIEALRARKIPLLGVIVNGVQNRDNVRAIEKFGRVPVVAEVFPMCLKTIL